MATGAYILDCLHLAQHLIGQEKRVERKGREWDPMEMICRVALYSTL